MILTPAATKHIVALLRAEPEPRFLRVSIQGGGCAGMEYRFDMEAGPPEDDDTLFGAPDLEVRVDPISLPYLSAATLDYKVDLSGSRFVFSNPAVKSSCGCGSSFSA